MVEAPNTPLATPLITYSLNRVLTLLSILVSYLLSTTCLATTITLKTESSFKAACGAILRAVSTLFVHKLRWSLTLSTVLLLLWTPQKWVSTLRPRVTLELPDIVHGILTRNVTKPNTNACLETARTHVSLHHQYVRREEIKLTTGIAHFGYVCQHEAHLTSISALCPHFKTAGVATAEP